MAPISPGNGAASRKTKSSTSTNTHRFESFTNRISRLKIDPIHTLNTRQASASDLDLKQSFFRNALQEWSELNLSATFTSFSASVTPLCETLPQLLYHADQIFNLLLDHIEKQDELGLEPLLSLLAHLAHDLGHGFEKYFARTVTQVAQVAAAHSSFDVIEWCFTCLGWMFKYLSRLLVEDMRPLLDILRPYISAKKQYIARFTGESLAFLLRKASMLFSRRQGPLKLAITHLLGFCADNSIGEQSVKSQNGLMTLLVETAAGVDKGLHSCAVNLTQCILDVAPIELAKEARVQEVLEGFIVGLLHCTETHSLAPLLQLVNENALLLKDETPLETEMMAGLLKIIIGVDSGSKIDDWKSTIQAFISLFSMTMKSQRSKARSTALSVGSMMLSYPPIDHLLPFSNALLDVMTNKTNSREFLSYCVTVDRLGKQRFEIFLLPRLQDFISSHWAEDEIGLCFLLEQLRNNEPTTAGLGKIESLRVPLEWEASILDRLSASSLEDGTTSVESVASNVRLAMNLHLPRNADNEAKLIQILHKILIEETEPRTSQPELRTRLKMGWIWELYLKLLRRSQSTRLDYQQFFVKMSPTGVRLPSFLRASLQILKLKPGAKCWEPTDFTRMQHYLIENLVNGSLLLKTLSLKLLKGIFSNDNESRYEEVIDLALEILETPYIPANTRKIAMLLRQLPQLQRQMEQFENHGTESHRMIPLFCIGLLPIYHEKSRHDLCSVLSEIASSAIGENVILDVILEWTRNSSSSPRALKSAMAYEGTKPSRFQSPNALLAQNIMIDALAEFENSLNQFRELLEQEHAFEPLVPPIDSRFVALQFLSHIPKSAEKRSRLLTPIFLASENIKNFPYLSPASEISTSSHTLTPELEAEPWSSRDRIAFLRLLTKFANPKVIFRSEEIHQNLFEYLSNGNAEVRKLAIQALSSWKNSNIREYEAALLRIADDKVITADATAILSTNSEFSIIKQGDRSVVLPVLIRILFGHVVSRTRAHGSLEARRKSILRAIFRMQNDEVACFLNIASGRLANFQIPWAEPDQNGVWARDIIPTDQQHGFLRLMSLILDTIRSQFSQYANQLFEPIVYCTLRSCRQMELDNGPVKHSTTTSLVRNTRKTGFQCLIAIFENCPEIEWRPVISVLFAEAVSPRLASFATETAQGVSGLLRIFSTWTKRHSLVSFLQDHDSRLLPAIWECMSVSFAQDEVRTFILQEVIVPLLDLAEDEAVASKKAASIVRHQIAVILRSLTLVLENSLTKDMLENITSLVPRLSGFAASSGERNAMLSLLIKILCQSTQKMTPRAKSSLLAAVNALLQPGEETLNEWTSFYRHISTLLGYFKGHMNRLALCEILVKLGQGHDELQPTLMICSGLNSVSESHLDEVDFDRRIQAFDAVSKVNMITFEPLSWLPIMYNLVYFMTDEDFSIRSNSISCLKQYVIKACASTDLRFRDVVVDVIVPAVQRGVQDSSEITRADVVSLYGLLVQHLGEYSDIHDSAGLLFGNDEEASFFSNILHVQQHRRVRAIRRLAAEVDQGVIKSTTISNFFIPLLEKFIYENDSEENDENLKGQSMLAMSTLLKWLDWKLFKFKIRHYKMSLNNEELKKTNIKLLSYAVDALSEAWERKHQVADDQAVTKLSSLAASLPQDDVVWAELKTQFIPFLANFVHYKDESELSFRIPAAVIFIKLVKVLPSEQTQSLSAPVLLDVTQILRSRAFESRELARKAINEIVVLLGPSSVQFVLREMKHALTRGYQLHVLSYSLHSALVSLNAHLDNGALDHCLEDLVSVALEDIFGNIGAEKDSLDYVSSMKEVKSSKSLDTMELLASCSSVHSLVKLIEPIEILLTGALAIKQVRKVDEVLRRVGAGLSRNPGARSRETLIFAYQTIQSCNRYKSGNPSNRLTKDEENRKRFIIQLSRQNRTTSGATSSLLYKVSRFALDIVRTTFQKNEALITSENLFGFLPVIGDALLEAQEDVKVSALRLLCTLIKLPMTDFDENIPIYVIEAVRVVRNSSSTNEEAAQAALKFVAAVLRERKGVKVRENDVADLLHRITPDLEEPDRQGVTFNFIRAVMARKFKLPQIYDLADKIGTIMVTSQSGGARDVARGVYVHFLLNYPQSPTRWSKHQKFLMKNLEYDYPEGRQSVMEAINLLIQKLRGDMAEQFISMFSVPVILRMSSDEDEKCRELAGALLSQLFSAADPSQIKELTRPLKSWVEQTDNLLLTQLGFQTYGILLKETIKIPENEIGELIPCLTRTLSLLSGVSEAWEICYQALHLLLNLVTAYPTMVLAQKQEKLWLLVCDQLNNPHVWIQDIACCLLSAFFQDVPPPNMAKNPLKSAHGVYFDAKTISLVLKSLINIAKHKSDHEHLRNQVIPNVVFLARCVEVNGLTIQVKAERQTVYDENGADSDDSVQESDLSSAENEESEVGQKTKSIAATKYILDQLSIILRREPRKLTSPTVMSKKSALQLLASLIPQLSETSLNSSTVQTILLPLRYLTDTSTIAPRSTDPTFSSTYQSIVESAHEVMEIIQKRLGDTEYVKVMTEVSKIMRTRREDRRTKRRIEKVTEPEKVAQAKRRKSEKKKERKKEIVKMYQSRRRQR